MYQLVTGPLAWLSFAIFSVGLIARTVIYIRGLDWKLDRVAYREYFSHGIKHALRSIFFWLVPFGTRSWRFYPMFTVLVFVFHVGLIVTPIFLIGHNVLLQERWGFSLWTIPERVADALTIGMIVAAVLIVVRRNALPEVRILTTPYDYFILAIAVAPFATGFIAHQQVGNYPFWLILHILCGEIMLIAIPFTKLSHFIMFFLSRAQLGMDYGIKRGGMKGRGMAW